MLKGMILHARYLHLERVSKAKRATMQPRALSARRLIKEIEEASFPDRAIAERSSTDRSSERVPLGRFRQRRDLSPLSPLSPRGFYLFRS